MTLSAQNLSRYLPNHSQLESVWDKYSSTDFENIHQKVASLFCQHRLEPAEKLDYSHGIVRGHAISIVHMRYGGAVRVLANDLHDAFLVPMPVSGNIQYLCGRQCGTATETVAFLPKLDTRYSFYWSADCESLIARIDRSAIESHLSTLLQRPLSKRLDFDIQLQVTTHAGLIWLRAIRDFIDHLQQARELKGNHWLHREQEDLLLSTLLYVQPNNYSQALEARFEPNVTPRKIRVAEEYIRANAHDVVTVSDLVTVAGMGPRGLRAAFKKYHGCTPLQYLRSVRMECACKELRDGEPGTTVTGVAIKWGFAHFGRFAAAYKRQFGESPSASLRR
jgi:AraC-like DNA-binding protein